MSMPLSPRSPASLNRHQLSPEKHSSPTKGRAPSPEMPAAVAEHNSPDGRGTSSSPFQTEVSEDPAFKQPYIFSEDKENLTSSTTFKIHDDKESNESTIKFSPKKSTSSLTSSKRPSPRKLAGDETLSRLREEIFVNQYSSRKPSDDDTIDTFTMEDGNDNDAVSTVSEDTCFSNFSAVPNADMTQFASIGMRSPSRRGDSSQTPTHGRFFTPGTSRRNHQSSSSRPASPSPTPRQHKSKQVDGDTTNLLLDFTQQFEGYSGAASRSSPTKRGISPTKTEPNLLSYLNNQRIPSPSKGTATPAGSKRNVLNLLDFDLPPQPTPRSVPTITVREIESMKSNYLSEISSLKANLSGKEAEIESLKKAVSDAERRVGEALENVREERDAREHAEKEKAEWEKKGQEVECVLQNVREEFVYAEKEKEDLLQKLEESNRQRDEAELRVEEAATKASVAQSEVGVTDGEGLNEGSVSEAIIAQRVAQQLDEKMENLARELHGVYKKKHESKVATLKKAYELRSEKKCNEMQQKIEELTKQNDELQSSKDATFSGELPSGLGANQSSVDHQQLETQRTELQEQKAKMAGFEEEISSLRADHAQLLQELEQERAEKGELVAAVDEMLSLQSEVAAPSVVEDFRKSIGRPSSGLKTPGLKPPSGLARPTQFGKSKMMSNIERMGGSRGP